MAPVISTTGLTIPSGRHFTMGTSRIIFSGQDENETITLNAAIIEDQTYDRLWSTIQEDKGGKASVGTKWKGIASSASGDKIVAVTNSATADLDSTIYLSTDHGESWNKTPEDGADFLAIYKWNSVASSDDGSNLVASENLGSLWTSGDSGVSWTKRTTGTGNQDWRGVASSGNGKYVVACDYGNDHTIGGKIYRSDDYGLTWHKAPSSTGSGSRNWTQITMEGPYGGSANSTGVAHVAAADRNGKIYTSVNFGYTWKSKVVTGNGDQEWNSLTSGLSGTNYYLYACDVGKGIWRNTNWGQGADTWEEKHPNGDASGKQWRDIKANETGKRIVALSAASGNAGSNVYLSIDHGNTWEATMTPDSNRTDDWNRVSMSSDGTRMVATVKSPGGHLMKGVIPTLKFTNHTTVAGGPAMVTLNPVRSVQTATNTASYLMYEQATNEIHQTKSILKKIKAITNHATTNYITQEESGMIIMLGGKLGSTTLAETINVVLPQALDGLSYKFVCAHVLNVGKYYEIYTYDISANSPIPLEIMQGVLSLGASGSGAANGNDDMGTSIRFAGSNVALDANTAGDFIELTAFEGIWNFNGISGGAAGIVLN